MEKHKTNPDPLRHGFYSFWIKDKAFQSGKWTISINTATFSENVTIAFVVVAWAPWMQEKTFTRLSSPLMKLLKLRKFGRGQAN